MEAWQADCDTDALTTWPADAKTYDVKRGHFQMCPSFGVIPVTRPNRIDVIQVK